MELRSINVSRPQTVLFRGQEITTGIFKSPASGPVFLRTTNLDGDRQADLSVHGGRNKAVYVYPYEHYATWQQELGRDDFTFGQFGENFTVTGLLEDQVHLGDVFQIGEAIVEVTQPRIPCFKLGARMGSHLFPKLFLRRGRTGFYVRVVQEGLVTPGDDIQLISTPIDGITVHELWAMIYGEPAEVNRIYQAWQLDSLGPEWRYPLEKQLEELGVLV